MVIAFPYEACAVAFT